MKLWQGLYVYMLRVDCTPEHQDTLIKYIKTLSPVKWITSNEIGKTTNKPHQQGALCFKEKLTQTIKQKVRNYLNIQKWVHNEKGINKVAFKEGINPESLLKYSNDKEHLGMKTNFTQEELKKIGKWKDKDLDKKQFKDKIIEEYVKLKEENQRNLLKIEIIQTAVSVSIAQSRKPPPIKSLYYYAQLAGVITKYQVAEYNYGYEYAQAQQEAEQFSKNYKWKD